MVERIEDKKFGDLIKDTSIPCKQLYSKVFITEFQVNNFKNYQENCITPYPTFFDPKNNV